MLLLLLLFLESSTAQHLLSHHKPTYQSTVAALGVPQRAVDGNTRQHYGQNSCTHTHNHGNVNWWMVDLGERAKVFTIKIWNRGGNDCCTERINGAQVWVDETLCGTLQHSQSTYTLQCGEVIGRYVRVTQQAKILTLCEVEVYGRFTEEHGEGPEYPHFPILLSRHKPTDQSGGRNSGGAVDGVFKHASGRDGTCARTDSRSNNWWEVDLRGVYKVSAVTLYPRYRTNEDVLQGARVVVDGKTCGRVLRGFQQVYVVKCNEDLVGSRVRVMRKDRLIEICEVEVFGVKAVEEPTEPPKPDPSCEDKNSKCPMLARQQKCSEPGMLTKCPLSCNQCSCGDNFRYCKNLADIGMCVHQRDFTHTHCRQSCKLCQCLDTKTHCVVGAEQGLCSIDASFLKSCPLSCNQCRCGDNLGSCKSMALAGQCVSNPSYMLVHCAESCNQCGNCGDNPPFSSQCARKVERGTCQTHGNMALHCAASCGFCQADDGDDSSDSDDEENPTPWRWEQMSVERKKLLN